jgi:hypothetical protein
MQAMGGFVEMLNHERSNWRMEIEHNAAIPTGRNFASRTISSQSWAFNDWPFIFVHHVL